MSKTSIEVFIIAAVLTGTHAQFENTSSIVPVNQSEDIQLTFLQPDANLQVYAIPVGQGDCIIMQCPNGNIVVLDCGSNGGNGVMPAQIQDSLGNARLGRVVAIIISHPHQDHFNYLNRIDWKVPTINQVIIAGNLEDYNGQAIYNWLRNFASMDKLYTVNNGNPCIGNCVVQMGTDFCETSNIQFGILAANVRTAPNEMSIVMKAVVSQTQFSMLLPGDMEGEAADTIAMTLGSQLQSNVYKMAHHGASRLANSPTWLAPIRPTNAFASSGYNFGNCRHPRCETIGRIMALNTIVPAPTHDFYCGNPDSLPPTQFPMFPFSMYETSPTPNMICMLVYLSSGQRPSQCFQLAQLSDDVGGEECQQLEEEGEGGVPPTMASYTATVTMVLFYFILILF